MSGPTEARLDPGDIARNELTCPRCSAQPGEPCLTSTGKRSNFCHTARTRPVYKAWRAGYWFRKSEEARRATA